ncbi:exsB protein [Thermodesulfobacterium geofontis OPF15]|jgi:7-cyano-7-deazaguanine synthase|uniref:7-cyano-7-deazaguanine synthase n=1 Tax=Thermodesulfobacterium geofontis (strain OPF15) TaxID=795359 RepID=F8C3V8_THEGP|nr:7-cyano-7-deazaguanine synthase QueC [Thermodesulfobacterium geofontis]AEH23682.1 exsB protein [Thermodesulfobacterium geofontis OPF15]
MKNELAIVLLSGGMDSTVCASIASQNYRLAFLHFQYGQKAQKKELECFYKLIEFFKPEKFQIVYLPFFKDFGGSSLISEELEIPEKQEKGIPSTYVPFRNGIFLSIATAWAEVIGAKKIFIGVNEVDFSGYPDCRKIFIEKFNQAINVGTKPETQIEIETPIINLTKKEIVELGIKLNTPFHLTWSCYRGGEKACGKCDSCNLRLKAFKEAGIKDPILYENV